ncbi:hypothetical protein HDU76_003839 [Blyttiomyces sp. JEL0837]|nr:hypothetical protein HDU76_003839 [Blyttiomyces sp. JEL0837]
MNVCASGMSSISSAISSATPTGGSIMDPTVQCATAYYQWYTDINTCIPGSIDASGPTSALANMTLAQASCLCTGQVASDSAAISSSCASIDASLATAATQLSSYLNSSCASLASMTDVTALVPSVAIPTFSVPATVSAIIPKGGASTILGGGGSSTMGPSNNKGSSSAVAGFGGLSLSNVIVGFVVGGVFGGVVVGLV